MRISNERYLLTPAQRAEVIKKQKEREPERLKRWNQEIKRQIAAEKERNRWDHSAFPRGSH
ncbi:MAG: hypothetical protein ACRCSV_01600 [Chlamydiales bacterium]